jgi:hypothetical protein
MGFLQPLALLALGAAAIPALLHLLQRREPPTVPFPAVRYLAEAERRHNRRLKLRHLLLLLLRTALVAAVVLAASRPVMPVPWGGAHAPSALVVVIDNSLSSGAVRGGRRVLDRLVEEAKAVIGDASPADRVWVLGADGIPREVDRVAAGRLLDNLAPEPVRMDLTDAVRTADGVLAGTPMPGEIVVVSDAQATALPAGPATTRRVLVVGGEGPLPNRGLDTVRVTPPTWSPGGRVVATLSGAGGGAGEVSLVVDGRVLGRDLAGAGDAVTFAVAALPAGWHHARVAVSPDELRLDDSAHVALWAAPPAAVTLSPGAGAFVEAAVGVLEAGGRVRRGAGVTIGPHPAGGRSLVLPPDDPAQLGALNRTLAARGIPVRFGELVEGEWEVSGDPSEAAGARVTRRHRLSGDAAVLARAGGEPWLVQSGEHVVLASRFDEGWTSLPVSAAFVPLLDALINRVAASAIQRVEARPGEVVTLPAIVTAALFPGGRVVVAGDRRIGAPSVPGVYFLLGAAGDTAGALMVNPDPRESDLTPAGVAAVRAAIGPAADVRPRLAGRVFGAGRRAEVSTGLLVLALALAAAELAVSSAGGVRRAGAP